MKFKHFLFTAMLLFIVSLSMNAQTILGGGGVCAVSGDPDNITALQTQNPETECMVSWDVTNQALYVYDNTQAAGNRWTEVPLTSVVNSDTRLDNPQVVGTNLTFDVIDVISGGVAGTETIDITSIAPIQSIVDGGDITVTGPDANGVVTVTYDDPIDDITEGTGISVTNTAGSVEIANTAPNVDQTLSANIGIGTTGIYTINLTNGGSLSIAAGTGISFEDFGGSLRINVEDNKPVADNYDDANSQGVPINGTFVASLTNTMGAVPGTNITRLQ